MAGEAKTANFMLGTATVMLGAPADLHDLNPTNSIGLVKNFRIQAQPTYTDLMQGRRGAKVFSVLTGNEVTASMEVYEYTAANLTYGLGMEGYSVTPATEATTVATAALSTATTLPVTSATGLTAGTYVAIDLGHDNVIVRRVVSVATNTLTLNTALDQAVAQGAVVRKLNAVDIGSRVEQPFLAAKIVGELADGSKVTILCPKIRITNGFSVGFTTDNFDNLPFEFAFYDLLASDPNYAEFNGKQAMILV